MTYFAGLAGGFSEAATEERQRRQAKAERDAQMEQSILGTLVQSDNPELQQIALTGLLMSAQPRAKAKGLGGWLGEVEASPALGSVRKWMARPGAAALPPASPVEPKAQAPGRPVGLQFPSGETLGGPEPASAGPMPDATQGPPPFTGIFMTEAQKAAARREAELNAGLRVYRGAQTPEERDLIAAQLGRPERRFGKEEYLLTVDDGQGGTQKVAGYWDQDVGEYRTAQGEKVYPLGVERPGSGASTAPIIRSGIPDGKGGFWDVWYDRETLQEIQRTPSYERADPNASPSGMFVGPGGLPYQYRGGVAQPIAGAPPVAEPQRRPSSLAAGGILVGYKDKFTQRTGGLATLAPETSEELATKRRWLEAEIKRIPELAAEIDWDGDLISQLTAIESRDKTRGAEPPAGPAAPTAPVGGIDPAALEDALRKKYGG